MEKANYARRMALEKFASFYPTISPSAFVAQSADVIGRVKIEE